MCSTAGCVEAVGWGVVLVLGRSEGTDIAVTLRGRSEGLVSVWHQCTPKEPAAPGGHGDVGVAGRDVGDTRREEYLRSGAALLLDSVSLGDLPSAAAGELRQGPPDPDTRLILGQTLVST